METIQGNILDYGAPYYIAHQCNCQSKRDTTGLSAHIFKKYPAANDYKNQTWGTVGTIRIHSDFAGGANVINMFAQLKPGKASGPLDNKTKRAEYFADCIQAIKAQVPKDATIVFPYGIGCGLAGGDWPTYETILKEFAKTNNVIIVKLP